uniref:Uncharacterized protein n=1 Tax=Macrococcoides canis TaxID=1855823 RepID=A0A6G5ZZE2_9STAP|nr:hypothetical protein 0076A_00039 [Macrococcus canis]
MIYKDWTEIGPRLDRDWTANGPQIISWYSKKCTIVIPLVSEGKLELKYPDNPKHNKQAYKTKP